MSAAKSLPVPSYDAVGHTRRRGPRDIDAAHGVRSQRMSGHAETTDSASGGVPVVPGFVRPMSPEEVAAFYRDRELPRICDSMILINCLRDARDRSAADKRT